ncbi:hypothetical protein A1O3_05292 [Capronia epimyces CBS 606.96]|uniref:Major facilitator superfamily (MFS) profile domain-containing protein n=1 Tax=Capronia epimyces CBS 606.96 TaxID=1182542 RepID=W9XVM7_9EURO|nr:uncharacterized protein A1O3_05292 [Capronia epimyces CBS 606.96]EXJ84622.1 hypothetical protein A1O3_05292 [Capronia epimyces CBS 606.96]
MGSSITSAGKEARESMTPKDDFSAHEGKGEGPDAGVSLASSNRALERKIVMKTDAVILTFVTLIAFLMFLDKNCLAYANILGMKVDTHLQGQEYSWLGSIFYFGYLTGMPVSAFLITKVPVGRLLGVAASLWGVVMMCMAACNNFAGLATVRFFLGLLESPAFPSAMILIGNFWKRSEQPLRIALWYNTFAGIFGGLLAFAINTLHGHLANWRYLFLIYGSVTVLLGILAFFFLPVSPATAWFLTPTEKQVAIARLADTQQKNNNDRPSEFKLYQCLEALRSIKFWVMILLVLAQGITAAGITNFNPLIIKGFGFSTQRTNLLAAPQAAVGIVAQVALSLLAYFIPNSRCFWWIVGTMPALAGAIVIHSVDVNTQRPVALGGVYLMGFYNVAFVMAMAIITANTRGSTKRPFVNASMGVALSVAEIVGPQFFRQSQAPYYQLGIWALVVSYAVMIATGGLYWLIAVMENKIRDRNGGGGGDGDGVVAGEDHDASMAMDVDLTDGENKAHRFSY